MMAVSSFEREVGGLKALFASIHAHLGLASSPLFMRLYNPSKNEQKNTE